MDMIFARNERGSQVDKMEVLLLCTLRLSGGLIVGVAVMFKAY